MRGFSLTALRCIAAYILIVLSVPAQSQNADTIRLGSRVIIRSNHHTSVFDSIEFALINHPQQREQSQPTQTYSRLQNDCGVTSSFTPGNDSIINQYTNVTFTSTSINAVSYAWLLNGIVLSNAPTFQFDTYTPGVYEIKLVAINGACSDTSVCYYLYGGSQPADRNNFKAHYGIGGAVDDYASSLVATKGGGFLIGGYFHRWASAPPYFPNEGLLIKTAESGCIEWTRSIATTVESRVLQIAQVKDSGYAITGHSNYVPYLMKLDKLGNKQWSKTYRTADYRYFFPELAQIAATSDGGTVMAGTYWGESMSVVRTDASGNIRWNKSYQKTSQALPFYMPYALLQDGNDVYVSGTVITWDASLGSYTQAGFIMNLDDATGSTRWTKKYSINGMNLTMYDIHLYGSRLLVNSSPGSGIINANNAFHVLERDGSVVRSTTLVTPTIPYGTARTNLKPLPNGDIYFLNSGTQLLPIQPGFVNHSLFIKIDSLHTMKWASDYAYLNCGAYNYLDTGANGSLVAAGGQVGSLIQTYGSLSENINFKKIDSTGQNNCQAGPVSINFISTPAIAENFSWSMDRSLPLLAIDTSFGTNELYAEVRYLCPTEFIDSCSVINLSGPASICNINKEYTYKAHRNATCNQPIRWEVSTGITVINESDDEITVRFTSHGSYKISSYLPFACTPVKDSIIIAAEVKTPALQLGSDTTICPNTTLTLHAGPYFMLYEWQDGSQDSLFTLNREGIYWVKATDFCGNTVTDTIVVRASLNLSINAGPDLSKCNADTLHIHAPAGYLNYSWSPNYNINSTSGQHVVVNPLLDTAYVLRAEKTPGCFAYDTIRVTVKHSPKIDLGPDRSFCKTENLFLDAGPGFISYRWNTGSNSQRTLVQSAGFYSVAGTDAQGCQSLDIMRVIALYESPVIKLDKDSTICYGTTKLLNVGSGYTSYAWSNGGTGSSISVSTPGQYWVTVTNSKGCKGRDTTRITTIMPKPSSFLPEDTAICSYGSVMVKTLSPYHSYLWSNSASTSSITITRPGLYWAEVTDNNQCKGKDSIMVYSKECLMGLYIPNAFTPNNDGHNDLFAPQLYGKVVRYQFIIFNRWGQMLFRSHELTKGWDGTYSGSDQKSNVFTWVCVYQLEGETERTERGTVTLIR